jgi:hypothetical protein
LALVISPLGSDLFVRVDDLTVLFAFIGLLPTVADALAGTRLALVAGRAPVTSSRTDTALVVRVVAVVDADARVARALPLLVIVFDTSETFKYD